MTDVTAPYNFVPLSKYVCGTRDIGFPEQPSQDQPQGGLSGVLDVTLSCDGPLLVNWGPARAQTGDDNVKTFGLTPSGMPAIPGSTLRGMIRNVLEIAAFGKMALVDDAKTGVRDLTKSASLDYGRHITTTTQRNGAFVPLSRAGWLRFDDNAQIRITPCEFARIDHSDLSNLSKDFRTRILARDDATLAPVVQEEFLEWSDEQGLQRSLYVEDTPTDHKHGLKNPKKPELGHKHLNYRKAALEQVCACSNGNATQKRGTLVFTGMPSLQKHMEFFFFDEREDESFEVPEHVWKGFLDVHERQEKVSDTWNWRRAALNAGEAIPVFYLTDTQREISHLGLAMMFKLPADNSIGQMIANTSPEHSGNKVDLPEMIFGRLESGKDMGDGWRGRVSFGWAFADADTWVEPQDSDVRLILAKPKPSFVPAYVRQRDFKSAQGLELLTTESRNTKGDIIQNRANYRSYMDWTPLGQARPVKEEIRGWKRYPVGPERGIPPRGASPVGDGVSILRPLRPASPEKPITFNFRLRYHNLHQLELGALLWAITWGGDERLRHALGMGRPLGWGQVKLSAQLTPDYAAAVSAFIAAMETWANHQRIPGGWADSVQLRQLKSMADPAIGAAQSTQLKQMILVVGQTGRNDFLKAKEAGHILPEYACANIADMTGLIDHTSIKINKEISEATLGTISATNANLAAFKTAKPAVRFQKNDLVRVRIGANKVEGIALAPTREDGQTLVEFYRSPSDRKKNRKSQSFFGPTVLESWKQTE